MSAPEIRPLMQGVLPYLTVDGAEGAIVFYRRAFGAVQHGDTVKHPDGRVLNASLEIHHGMIMLNDLFAEHGGQLPSGTGVAAVQLQLVVADGDAWWSRAVDAGCTVTEPFGPAFWGGRYGRLRDPYGHDWALHEPPSTP